MVREWIDNDGIYRLEPDEVDIKQYPIVSKHTKLPYYLATPYSKMPGGLQTAHDMACEMTAFLLEKGLFVFSPIVNSHFVKDFLKPENRMSHEFWLGLDFKYIKISAGIIVVKMLGWQESYGINEEIKLATKLGLPIYYTNFLEVPEGLRV